MENQTEFKIPGVDDVEVTLPPVDELAELKAKADLMGVSYHPAIGLEKLRVKVNDAIAGEKPAAATETMPSASSSQPAAEPAAVLATPVPSAPPAAAAEPERPRYRSPLEHANAPSIPVEGETEGQKRSRLKRHALELIRIRVTCMDPKKKEYDGEIFTAGNSLVGSVKKYVPFAAEDGWHVPRIIYNMMRDRQAQIFVTQINKATGVKFRAGKQIKEFAIEVMEPLSPAELAELAARQAATGAID